MLYAINTCQFILQQCTQLLLSNEAIPAAEKEMLFFNIDDVRHGFNETAQHSQITIGPELPSKKVVIFNPSTFTRTEVVTFYVSTAYVEVSKQFLGLTTPCQKPPRLQQLSKSDS